jgi:hypothetical protein
MEMHMKIKIKTKMEVKIKIPNSKQTKPGTPVQKKFKILSAIPYPSTTSTIHGPRNEPKNKVIEILNSKNSVVQIVIHHHQNPLDSK